jgi:hypothetical protein
VQAVPARRAAGDVARPPAVIDAAWLRELCLAAGADDASAVSLTHRDLAGEREHAQAALPGTRTLIAMAVRMNRDNCRSPARSVANQEFHQADEQANHAARKVTQALQDAGYRALNPSVLQVVRRRLPGRRHQQGRRLRRARLHHAQLPRVHERVHRLGADRGRQRGRRRLPLPGHRFRERLHVQSLAQPPGYKSGYCLAVCPAGEDVLGPYLDDRKTFMDTVLRPLQGKKETLYVLPGSHAQEYAERRFPHKPVKEVTGGWQPPTKRHTAS